MAQVYKNNQSVLVLVYAQNTGRLLMLQRADDPDFWQSVTGSLEQHEAPAQCASREIKEEIGLDLVAQNLRLFDCQRSVSFEIFPHFRYKYAPNITHCTEHWFLLALPEEITPKLTEHLAFQWLTPQAAARLTKSWNNRLVIETYFLNEWRSQL